MTENTIENVSYAGDIAETTEWVESLADVFGVLPLCEAEHIAPLVSVRDRVASRGEREPDAERMNQPEIRTRIPLRRKDDLVRKTAVYLIVRHWP